MMRKIYIGFFLIIIISCSNNKEYINKIEELELSLDSAQVKYRQIDTSYVKNTLNEAKILSKTFYENIGDTTNRSLTMRIVPLDNLSKSLSRFLRSYMSGSFEFEYSKNQLKTLKEDIQKNVLLEEEITKYMESEEKAVQSLKKFVNDLEKWQLTAAETKKNIIPNIELLVDSLKKNRP